MNIKPQGCWAVESMFVSIQCFHLSPCVWPRICRTQHTRTIHACKLFGTYVQAYCIHRTACASACSWVGDRAMLMHVCVRASCCCRGRLPFVCPWPAKDDQLPRTGSAESGREAWRSSGGDWNEEDERTFLQHLDHQNRNILI